METFSIQIFSLINNRIGFFYSIRLNPRRIKLEKIRTMKCLITGCAGRLGRELVKIVVGSGGSVMAFDLPNVSWDVLEGIPQVEAFPGNVTDPNQISEACGGVDVVVHLAALLPPRSEVDNELTFKVNVEGTRNLVMSLKSSGSIPLILASSISTYGKTVHDEPPLSEDRTQKPHNIYSESKIKAEKLIRTSRIPHVILRIAPIAVTDLVELPALIPFRADQRVEFVHVTDAARALFEASINPEALGKTFNIAGGPSWQMTGAEYIEKIYGALGVEVNPVFSEEYTALDWYDTSRSDFLGYQRTNFNGFLYRLKLLGEELGLR